MKFFILLAIAAIFLSTLFIDGHRRKVRREDPPAPKGAVLWDQLPVSGRTQADANLLRFPNGKNILIDAGEVNPLVPMLHQLGVTHLDRILISHPHKDHFGGLYALMESDIHVDEVDMNVPLADVCEREKGWGCDVATVLDLQEKLRAHGIRVGTEKAGDVYFDAEGIRLELLFVHDGVHEPIGPTDANDTSAILLLTVGTQRVLFPGDLNNKVGTYLVNQKDARLSATLLKAPHHGTEGCAPNSFFDLVSPTSVFVPAPEELWKSDRSRRIREYWAKAHIPAYVTGIVGRVHVVILPNEHRIYLPGD